MVIIVTLLELKTNSIPCVSDMFFHFLILCFALGSALVMHNGKDFIFNLFPASLDIRFFFNMNDGSVRS